MGLSAPRADSIEIVAFHPVKIIFRGLTQLSLVPLGPTLLILFPYRQF